MSLTLVQKQQIVDEALKAALYSSLLQEQTKSISAKSAELKDADQLNTVLTSLTTIRNRNLISQEQQRKLQQTVIGFFGLSVGSHAVLTWMLQSRADTVKIIDPDTIDATNLNRLRLSIDTIGKKKADVLEEQLIGMNPGVNVIKYTDVSSSSYQSIFCDYPLLDAIVDEIDDLQGKIYLRTRAKKYKIPVISATDVGDNVVLDIERHDLEPNYPFFHGVVPDLEQVDLNSLNRNQRIALTLKIVGLEHCSIAMLKSLLEIGKSIETWPQLAATATIAGGVVATTLKKIFLGESVRSGRYVVSLDTMLSPDSEDKKIKQELILALEQVSPYVS